MKFDIEDSGAPLVTPATEKIRLFLDKLPDGKLLTRPTLAEQTQFSERYLSHLSSSFREHSVMIRYGLTRKLVYGSKKTIAALKKDKPDLIYRG